MITFKKCLKWFNSSRNFSEMSSDEDDFDSFPCYLCKRKFNFKEDLYNHNAQVHNVRKTVKMKVSYGEEMFGPQRGGKKRRGREAAESDPRTDEPGPSHRVDIVLEDSTNSTDKKEEKENGAADKSLTVPSPEKRLSKLVGFAFKRI